MCVTKVRKVVQRPETFQDRRAQQPGVPSEIAEAASAVHVPSGGPHRKTQLMDDGHVAMAVRSTSRLSNVLFSFSKTAPRCFYRRISVFVFISFRF